MILQGVLNVERSTKILLSSIGLVTLLLLFFVKAPLRFYWLTKTVQFYPKNADSLCELGKMYYKGEGTPRDTSKAFECFQIAANLNSPYGHYKLGDMHSHRHDIQKGPETEPDFWKNIPLDLDKAVDHYAKAAVAGYANAYLRIGYFRINGIGIKQDYSSALGWFAKAAHLGKHKAQWWLGYLYSHAIGYVKKDYEEEASFWDMIPLDYPEALKWYIRAAQSGDPECQYMIGYFYEHGGDIMQEFPGIPLNHEEAVKWYTLAANQNFVFALCQLAHLYHNGHGVEKDEKKAFDLYLGAAHRDNAAAQRWVGCSYEEGEGVGRNYHQALIWYKKASQNGDELALEYLNRLHRRLK